MGSQYGELLLEHPQCMKKSNRVGEKTNSVRSKHRTVNVRLKIELGRRVEPSRVKDALPRGEDMHRTQAEVRNHTRADTLREKYILN